MVYTRFFDGFWWRKLNASSTDAQRKLNASSTPALTPMTVPGNTPVGQLLAKLTRSSGRGRGRRSPLYLWFREHHDELAAGFIRTPPVWKTIADALAEQGVRDASGKPHPAETVRAAWWRVRRDLGAAKPAITPPTASEPVRTPQGVREVPHPPSLPMAASASPPAPLQPIADIRPRMPPLKARKA